MKAVNLIPAGAGRASGPSGAPSYVVLGVLALLVVLATAYTLAGRTIAAKKTELAQVTTQADDVEARAGDLESYTQFANARRARVETVKGLIGSRVDWAHTMGEVARTLPAGAWITSLRATVNPSVTVDGASDPLRTAIASPAVELAGCAKDQEQVARVMASLRAMSKVERVTLSSSEKKGDGTAASSDGCGTRPQFSLAIFFEAPGASPAVPGAAASATTTAAGGATP